MDSTKIEAAADHLSMDLATRVVNQTLTITEAMYSLVTAISFLLGRTLPEEAFQTEYEDSKALAHEMVEVINQYIAKNGNKTSTARLMVSLSLVMELVMEQFNQPNS
jgi:hypothetical protein